MPRCRAAEAPAPKAPRAPAPHRWPLPLLASFESLHSHVRHALRPVVDGDTPGLTTHFTVFDVFLVLFPTRIERDLDLLSTVRTGHHGGAIGGAVPQRKILAGERVVRKINHYFLVYTSDPNPASPALPAYPRNARWKISSTLLSIE